MKYSHCQHEGCTNEIVKVSAHGSPKYCPGCRSDIRAASAKRWNSKYMPVGHELVCDGEIDESMGLVNAFMKRGGSYGRPALGEYTHRCATCMCRIKDDSHITDESGDRWCSAGCYNLKTRPDMMAKQSPRKKLRVDVNLANKDTVYVGATPSMGFVRPQDAQETAIPKFGRG